MSKYLELSSRITSYADGSSNLASCNVFSIEDSISDTDGIADAVAWGMKIAAAMGAPTFCLGNIRAKGSVTRHGVKTAGVASLVKMLDSTMTYIRRPGKKNSASVCYLPADHPDLADFISPELTATLTTMYLGVTIDPEKTYSPEILAQLVSAYNSYRIFICKLMRDDNGNVLYPNVCTEIRIPHKGMCNLAAIKLHEMSELSIDEFAQAFRECAEELIGYLPTIENVANQHPHLYRFTRQVGLGFVGMANFIGQLGTSYQEIVDHWEGKDSTKGSARFFVLMTFGLQAGSKVQQDHNVERLWTSQPTAHTALRLFDGEFAVAPELSPVVGGVRASDQKVRIHRKADIDSKFAGEFTYPEYCQTQEDVPYDVYRRFCEMLQTLIDLSFNTSSSTQQNRNKSHTFSHCFYGDQFTMDDLQHFIDSPLYSLYYRLPATQVSLDKSSTLDDVGDISDMFSDSPDTCPLDPVARMDCETCSM